MVSYIGYETKKITITSILLDKVLTVILIENSQTLRIPVISDTQS